MKRTNQLLFGFLFSTSFFFSSILCVPTLQNYGHKPIESYGLVNNQIRMMKKCLVIYSLSGVTLDEQTLAYIAGFDVLNVHNVYVVQTLSPYFGKIRSWNPDIIILLYHHLSKIGPDTDLPGIYDWVVEHKDEGVILFDNGGNPLTRVNTGNWHFDLTNPLVFEKLPIYISDQVQTHYCNGVMLDGCWESWRTGSNIWSNPPSLIPDRPNWHNEVRDYLTVLKNALGNKLLIPNTCSVMITDYVDIADGKVHECFMHFGTPDTIKQVDELKSMMNVYPNKLYAMGAGDIDQVPNTYEYYKWVYACALLAVDPSVNLLYGVEQLHRPSKGHYDFMDYETGKPLDDDYKLLGGNKYRRKFEYTTVTVDMTTKTATFDPVPKLLK